MIKVVIVEDDVQTVETIAEILNSSCKRVKIVGIANDINSALLVIPEKSPDLVFFDINLTGGTCFDIIQKLDNINFKIIFITAHDKYAIKAIKLSAMDYLLKPVDPKELIDAVNKVYKTIKNKGAEIQLNTLRENIQNKQDEIKHIVLRTFESIYPIDINDIARCESGGAYTFFYLKDGRKITVSRLLKEYDELLQNHGFFRVHQSHLININFINRFDKRQGGTLVMKDGACVPVSFRKKEKFLEIFENLSNLKITTLTR